MVGVRKINQDEPRETQFTLIRTDAGSLFWKEVESADKLIPFEKLLYRSFGFRCAAVIMQDYCDKLGENYALQEMIDELSEKLLSHDIVLDDQEEAKLFFSDVRVKKMLSVFQAFELLSVSITKALWQLLYVLQKHDSLIPDNLKILLSLSPDLYAQLSTEIINNVSEKTSPISLSQMLREKTAIDRASSPIVFAEVAPVSLSRPLSHSVNAVGLDDAPARPNQSSQFLTVRSMTLFQRSPHSSPFKANAKSPQSSCFSPVLSPRHDG
jgi:hypothetical protein